MLVTPEIDRQNRRFSLAASAGVAALGAAAGWLYPPLWFGLALAPVTYWFLRRRCLRRRAAARRPFPPEWRDVLERRVRFYSALDDTQQERFRQMVSVFLDEVRVTGVRTDVDDTIRVLVAAGAIIPIFGFHDWEYHRLGEVLIYPGAFDQEYQTERAADANILGLTGLGHLRGVVILSKQSLLAGFAETAGAENVGVHEFAHLVEQEEVDRGLPPEVPVEVVRQWVGYVARELAHPSNRGVGISDYAYTNEHEFFAVLSEYFFGSPEVLRAKAPALYDLLRKLFHQDPAALARHVPRARHRARPNGPCPCGSGKKFQDCCLHAPAKPARDSES
ncbi:zinc-dependent peptidase [Frigoriglobus tundricola]|uniref:zinc-dependent peptidase n=1 Tax=Frigoriglobus tundricola TaxID=2774151 RepID=UPI00148EB7E6|nr:zinc-dependent peptidase [Frigoriglobus tundricola]